MPRQNRINVDLLSSDHIDQLIVHAKNTKDLYGILRDNEQDRINRLREIPNPLPWDLDAIDNAKESIADFERNRVAYHTLIGALETVASVK